MGIDNTSPYKQGDLNLDVLLIGNGGREHAIAWKLKQSPNVKNLFIAPGNAGTSQISQNVTIDSTDLHNLIKFCGDTDIDLTVVGPEEPLSIGIVDKFTDKKLMIAGPTKSAAQLESSKAFAKEFMKRHQIPCAESMTFDNYLEASNFLDHVQLPIVIKADGLAAGKGVVVANSKTDASKALDTFMNQRTLGNAGQTIVIEEFLDGKEVSVFSFVDGEYHSPLVSACDYKRAYDGNVGPNTGGMGCYSPAEFWSEQVDEQIENEIFAPTVKGMAKENNPYKGVLYGGLMMTKQGPKVLEFNARLGDPETQVILPRLKSDLAEIMVGIAEGRLNKTRIQWSDQHCVGVVLTSNGYPESYETGFRIGGLKEAGQTALIFHAGTSLDNDSIVTSGGRVLTVVGQGKSISRAREIAYEAINHIRFAGAFYRKDIASFDNVSN
ncbi:MAG: phosphoribosylamine--glycine ligase [Chloroflexi bacterium]|nr:MAG: phosphoribosylamine--glycine ligase [Chloroflexota bacterium]